MNTKITLPCAALSILLMASCEDSGPDSDYWGGETKSLQSCLRLIEKTAADKIRRPHRQANLPDKGNHPLQWKRAWEKTFLVANANIVTDKPDKVSGWLDPRGWNLFFTCKRKATGTRGVIWEGMVEIPRK